MMQAAEVQSRPMERRRFQRVKVSILGRYMLTDRREYPCQTVDISPGGVALVAPVFGGIGERVVVYLEHLGRIEGLIVRQTSQGFAMTILASQRKRDKLAAQLTWLANRQALGIAEDRRHERFEPRRQAIVVTLPDGRQMNGRLIDISRSGASLEASEQPLVGSVLKLGRTRAQVVRHIEGGFAVEFESPLEESRISDSIDL